MISNPLFRKSHCSHSNLAHRNPKALLLTSTFVPASIRFMLLDPNKSFGKDGCEPLDLRSPMEIVYHRLRIVGSCYGLVCLDLGVCGDFFIWNPSTGECSKLPDPPSPLGKRYSPGFGYDSSSEDYKLVLVTYHPITKSCGNENKFRKTNYHMVAIFSLKSNSWRFEQFDAPVGYLREWSWAYTESAFLNGAIHWRSYKGPGLVGNSITAFDLAKETFYLIPYPNHHRMLRTCNTGVGVLGGCLCLILTNKGDNSRFELWVMKEYGVETSWSMILLLNPADPRNGGSCSLLLSSYEPLCASEDNTFILIRNREELIRFDERGEIVEKVWIGDDKTDDCQGIAFVESMVSADFLSNQR